MIRDGKIFNAQTSFFPPEFSWMDFFEVREENSNTMSNFEFDKNVLPGR